MRGMILIYGATGFTGRLLAERLKKKARHAPIVAGRTAHLVQALANRLNAAGRTFTLDEPDTLDKELADVDVVVNAAGPFTQTAGPLIEACLRTRTHYLDISGELPAFQTAHGYHEIALTSGIMIMPGVGLGVVASDCLATHVAAKCPHAKYLRIGLLQPHTISRGSLRAVLGMAQSNVKVRRNGALLSIPIGRLQRSFDYGDGERMSVAVSWADVFTAYFSTGIPNIETYVEANLMLRAVYQITAGTADLMQVELIQRWLSIAAAAWPEGPPSAQRRQGKCVLVAEAEDGWRRSVCSRLETNDGYDFTAEAAAEIARRVVSGNFCAGFQTPAKVYGADLILGFEGVRRKDLHRPFPTMPLDRLLA